MEKKATDRQDIDRPARCSFLTLQHGEKAKGQVLNLENCMFYNAPV
jgi:hypothetical protein